MTNVASVFSFENQRIDIIFVNGEPHFIGKQVCGILGYVNSRDAIAKHVDEEDKRIVDLNMVANRDGNAGAVSGGWIKNEMVVINESGLYSLILSSKLPTAKKFKHWVTAEVLPAIRKHGAYMTPATLDEIADNPDLLMKLAQNLKSEREKRIAAEKTIEEQKPKVLFADAVETSHTSILIGELAKLIKQNGVDIGQNRLFDWLRDNGYLIKGNRADKNMPTQAAMEMKLFEVKERTINNPDGSVRISRTPKVTGKGQNYFVNKFLNKKC